MDDLDRKIVTLLRGNGRRSVCDLALEAGGRSLSQDQLWGEVAAAGLVGDGRLLTLADPVTEPAILCEPLRYGGSLVLVAQAEPERLEATYVAEHATARFPA